MTQFESMVCQMAEDKTSQEIEAVISELQMISDRKYSEEENRNPHYSLSPEMDRIALGISKLSIYA
jgi:hypothetical protein